MGMGFTLHCRKCGYEISANLGVGFLFPQVYQQTMKAARSGKYGKTIKQFLEEHPDGTLNAERVLLRCTSCGNLGCGPDLSMYIRKPEVPRREQGRWSVAVPFEDAEYVSPMELEEEKTYELYGRGNICRKCGRLMEPITDNELEKQLREPGNEGRTEVPCPECGELMWNDGLIDMWD